MKLPAMLLLLLFLPCALAQENPAAKGNRVRVEMELIKPEIVLGSSLQYRILLVNESSSAVFISKRFGINRCGIGISAGFSVEVRQISGEPQKRGCGCGGGIGTASEHPRSPDEVLKEDFILLYPMQFVGMVAQYDSCNLGQPGAYEITARYVINKEEVGTVASLGQSLQILSEDLHSSAVRFRVVARPKK